MRTNGLQGRVLEGLRLTTTQTPHSPTQPNQQYFTSPQQQQQMQRSQQLAMLSPMTAARTRGVQQLYVISELPASPPPQEPQAWVPPPPPPPPHKPESRILFTPDQSERLRQHPREAPLLYHVAESTSSSEMQAEVNRRLYHHVRQYEGAAEGLRVQVPRLTREREELPAAQVRQNLPPGDRAYSQQPDELPSRVEW